MKKIASTLLVLFIAGVPAFSQLDKTPDTYYTEAGNELTVHPINHGAVVFTFGDKTIFVDPFGSAEKFTPFGTPDLVFITDVHGDHYSTRTLDMLDVSNATFVVPQAVADMMEGKYGNKTVIINNGESKDVMGIPVAAIPMYNLPNDETARHTKGRGNGYIISFDDLDVYLSGDTEDIPEMRSLNGIDIAFVCMNLPYTMDIHQASSAVIEFKPGIVYPYHHRGQDIEEFKRLVLEGDETIKVVLKNWY